MKSTRKYLLAVCALAIGFASPLIRAESDSTPPPRKESGPKGEPGARMKEQLGLTDEQAEKIKAIHAEERTQLKALRDKEGSQESKREEMKKIRAATKTKVDAVLTAEQREKAAKMRERMEERKTEKGQKEGKGPKAPPSPDSEM
jgi:protein CpxP